MQRKLLERAVHVIIILLGVLSTYYAYTTEGFARDLFLGLGTNLIVVTLVFMVFDYFRVNHELDLLDDKTSRRPSKSKQKSLPGDDDRLKNSLKDRVDNIESNIFPRDYGEKDQK